MKIQDGKIPMYKESESRNHMICHPEDKGDIVCYDERFDEYSIVVWQSSLIEGDRRMTERQQIYFCPWCGKKLPESCRDKWFDELEAQGIDPMSDELIPEKYQTSEWRKPAP